MKENKKEIVVKQDNMLTELKNTHELCNLLMKTPHYTKMGQEGIFAIVETAKSLGVDPRLALGGGLYFVRGKVEMSARMMSALIRGKKHSITRDKQSNDQICILHGRRADNGDCWTESFSIEEAKKAGLVRPNTPWVNFTRDMLYARALSRLARQLFSDIIGNCYIEGEISLDPNIKEFSSQKVEVLEPELEAKYEEAQAEKTEMLSENKIHQLEAALDDAGAIEQDIEELFKWKQIGDLGQLNERDFQDCMNFVKHIKAKRSK